MHKQLIVCVGIIVGACLLVAALGRDGLLALACTLLLCVAVSYFNHRRGDGGTKNKNFKWEEIDRE